MVSVKRGYLLLTLFFLLISGCIFTLSHPAITYAAPCDPPITNFIPCENSKPGNPSSEWDISGAGSSNIEGFATDISVNKGSTIQFKVNTNSNNYRLDIYRIGYYGGMGARKITTVNPSASLPQNQPNCLTNSSTGLTDCGNWAVSASWTVSSDAVSGVYIAKLVRQDPTSGTNHIIFIVRDDASTSDMLFQTSDTTWEAYNTYGGNSLYTGQPVGRAYKVSYNRPFITRSDCCGKYGWVFSAEYPMIRFLEANGYNISYSTGVDSDRRGNVIRNHKIFLSLGHDEYWSGNQRANVEAARDAGVNLAFFSGNEMFWKTRWENSTDGTSTPYRTLVSYKETHANAVIDPADPPTWTGTWRDPRFSPPADGGRPENAVTGTWFRVNGIRNDAMTIPFAYSKFRLWRNTSVADLQSGQTATFPIGTLGYEWDESTDNGFAPGGIVKLSSTTVDVSGQYLQDYGSTYGSGTATHNLTLYKSSGALVFGAGTVQWAWGLDSNHDNGSNPADPSMQQATINLFADMGVQPATLQPGLVAASASTDTAAPTSTITFPANGSNVSGTVTITGTATDAGGGLVGGVEISTDNGATWHQASGTTSWSYDWTPSGTGSFTIKSRAVDDSANLETPSAGVTVTVGSASQTIIFDDATSQDRVLNGQYPTGVVDWGTNNWYLSSPWGQFTTKSVSFNGVSLTSASFNLISPKRLVSLQAYNGGVGASMITLTCTGNTTKTQSVPNNAITTILTGWSSTCNLVNVSSSNGWNTNFDNLVIDGGGPVPSPTPTPTPTPPGQQTITFDNAAGQDRVLTGQYPTSIIDWGTNNTWWLSSPWGLFTGKSVSFNGPTIFSATFTFVTPKKFLSMQAYNGGSGASTITLTCTGNPTVTQTAPVSVITTISTGWLNPCASVTIGSSNNWFTNFNSLVIQ